MPSAPLLSILQSPAVLPTAGAAVPHALSQPPAVLKDFVGLPEGVKPIEAAEEPNAAFAPREDGDAPVFDLRTHPVRRFGTLEHFLRDARSAREASDAPRAALGYRSAMRLLAAPLGRDPMHRPLYAHLKGGGALLQEAIFGAAVFSEPAAASENVSMLAQFVEHPPLGHDDPLTHARAKILHAYAMMLLPVDALASKGATLWRAYDILTEVIDEIEKDAEAPAEAVHFAALMLSLEVTLQGLVQFHKRSKPQDRDNHLEAMKKLLRKTRMAYGSREERTLLADFEAEAALALASMGLWTSAVEIAQSVTSYPIRSRAAAERLLSSEPLKPFARDNRFPPEEWIRVEARRHPWHERARAALSHARVASPGMYFKFGITGMSIAVLANSVARGDHPGLAAGLGAAAAIGGYRFWAGWHSQQAAYDCVRGAKHQTMTDVAEASGKLIAKGALDAVGWGGPFAIAIALASGWNAFHELLFLIAKCFH